MGNCVIVCRQCTTTISSRFKWRTSYAIITIISLTGLSVIKRGLLFKVHAFLISDGAQDIEVVESAVKLGISPTYLNKKNLRGNLNI